MTREEVRDQLQRVVEVLTGMTAMLALEVTNQQVLEVMRDELDEVLLEVLPDAVQHLGNEGDPYGLRALANDAAALPVRTTRMCPRSEVHDPHDWQITDAEGVEHYTCGGRGPAA